MYKNECLVQSLDCFSQRMRQTFFRTAIALSTSLGMQMAISSSLIAFETTRDFAFLATPVGTTKSSALTAIRTSVAGTSSTSAVGFTLASRLRSIVTFKRRAWFASNDFSRLIDKTSWTDLLFRRFLFFDWMVHHQGSRCGVCCVVGFARWYGKSCFDRGGNTWSHGKGREKLRHRRG